MSDAARNHGGTEPTAAAHATVSGHEQFDDVSKYVNLINDHLAGKVDARAFTLAYLEKFKTEKRILTQETYDVLNALFADSDNYVDDPRLRDSITDLDSDQLRERVEFAAAKLTEHLPERIVPKDLVEDIKNEAAHDWIGLSEIVYLLKFDRGITEGVLEQAVNVVAELVMDAILMPGDLTNEGFVPWNSRPIESAEKIHELAQPYLEQQQYFNPGDVCWLDLPSRRDTAGQR